MTSSFIQPIVNPCFRSHWDGPFLVIDDFLKNIDEFRESLLEKGGFLHSQKNSMIADIGPQHDWRQLLESKDFPHEFNSAIAELQHMESPVKNYATNRFFSDMQIENRKLRSSNFPHTDYVYGSGNIPIVFNLWLHDGGGGTGFYTYDDFYTSSAMNSDLRYFVENYNMNAGEAEGSTRYNSYFAGDDDWKLWKVAEMKKNRAFIYCGDFWHRVLIPEKEFQFPKSRFSFVSFSSGSPDLFLERSGSLQYLKPIFVAPPKPSPSLK